MEMNRKEQERETALASEIEEFKREKERIRAIVGRIGGAPTVSRKLLNLLFAGVVIACFVLPFLFEGLHLPMIEFGITLISLKIVYLLHNHARQMHFIFWVLTSLEWRLNEIDKKFGLRNKEVTG